MMNLDYFYGQTGELFSFYRIPKALFQEPRFQRLSTDAKTLYGILLDRMRLSVKNGWLDKQNRVFILFTIEDVKRALCCADNKATKLLRELDQKGGTGKTTTCENLGIGLAMEGKKVLLVDADSQGSLTIPFADRQDASGGQHLFQCSVKLYPRIDRIHFLCLSGRLKAEFPPGKHQAKQCNADGYKAKIFFKQFQDLHRMVPPCIHLYVLLPSKQGHDTHCTTVGPVAEVRLWTNPGAPIHRVRVPG